MTGLLMAAYDATVAASAFLLTIMSIGAIHRTWYDR